MFAILLLVGYVLPYISPKISSYISVLSLTVPVLIVINIMFTIYWIAQVKLKFLLSIACLVIGYFVSSPLYIFSKNKQTAVNEISIMNYNVKLFNIYNWIDDKSIPAKINNFVKIEQPDILCVQEYHPSSKIKYPYTYIQTIEGNDHFGQAIYSKYRIVNKGSLNFEHTGNNAIFIDILKNTDTIRIYNLHLESLSLNVEKKDFGQKSSEKLIKHLGKRFIKQQNQVDKIIQHKSKCNYPVILSGDFNNTAYSWVYHKLKENMTDSFLESGSGFGQTFSLKHFPMRIDFIFADKTFIFTKHKNYTNHYSDHEPIMATVGI